MRECHGPLECLRRVLYGADPVKDLAVWVLITNLMGHTVSSTEERESNSSELRERREKGPKKTVGHWESEVKDKSQP